MSLTPIGRSRFGVPLLLVVLWQVLATAGGINTMLLPSPLAILAAWQRLIVNGGLLHDAQASLIRVGAGFALASFVGVFLGLLFARAPVASAGLRAVVEFLRPIPPIAWIPLAILWFGIGDVSAIFIVFTGSFFPIFLTTFQAADRVPEDLLQTARCYGARGMRCSCACCSRPPHPRSLPDCASDWAWRGPASSRPSWSARSRVSAT